MTTPNDLPSVGTEDARALANKLAVMHDIDYDNVLRPATTMIRALVSERDELASLVKELEGDAKRYVWVCEQDHKDRQWVDTFAEFKAQRDARIDAALNASKEQP